MKKIFTLIGAFACTLFFQIAAAQTLLSQAKTVTVSSTQNATTYPGAKAVDGTTTTEWISGSTNFNEWLYVDLATAYDIDYVIIKWYSTAYASTFDIMASNDASTWTTLRTISGNNTTANDTIRGLHGNYRYVKFNGRGRANGTNYGITEINVFGTVPTTPSQQIDLNLLSGQLLGAYTHTGIGDETGLMNSMSPDGSWSNINYGPTGNAHSHALRLSEMAEAWGEPGNVSYHDATMLSKIKLGMQYIINHNPMESNWWDNIVNIPANLLTTLTIIKTSIPTDSLYHYAGADYFDDQTGRANNEGMNRAWVSENLIKKGLLLGRFPLTYNGYVSEAQVLNTVSAAHAEGLMIDNSFHQHKDLLYNGGGYGTILDGDESTYINLAAGSQFATLFSSLQKQNLSSMMLSGTQLMMYRNSVDFGSLGRDITVPDSLVALPPRILDSMKLVDPTNSTNFQNWKDHIGGAAFPTAYLGSKYFWKSEILTNHTANFYMSAKIVSTRTYGTESLNGQNIKGANLPVGATNIMTTGAEYYNIFPTWRWAMIPGTTAENSEAAAAVGFSGGYIVGTNTFGGGVSDNDIGTIAFQQDFNGVTANKAYFFMENMLVCMGNNIRATKTNEIFTTINQALSSGAISYNDGSTHTMTTDSINTNTIQWVQHNNVGYLFPLSTPLEVTNRLQTGTWKSINTGASATAVSEQVFKLWVNHGLNPGGKSYYYIIAPDKQLADMPSLYSSHGFVPTSNTTTAQAIRNDLHQQYAAVFYAAGTVDMGDGLTVTSDKPAIVNIRKYSTSYRVSVGDPNYNTSTINITLNQHLTGANTNYTAPNTKLTFTMPGGDLTGSSYTQFFTISTTLGAMSAFAATPGSAEPDAGSGSGGVIIVYPNPAASVINVGGLNGPADIDVYNLAGHKFKTVHGTAVDVSDLQKGVTYFLRIHINGQIISRQFIKQ